jgi:hypothetical protein
LTISRRASTGGFDDRCINSRSGIDHDQGIVHVHVHGHDHGADHVDVIDHDHVYELDDSETVQPGQIFCDALLVPSGLTG